MSAPGQIRAQAHPHVQGWQGVVAAGHLGILAEAAEANQLAVIVACSKVVIRRCEQGGDVVLQVFRVGIEERRKEGVAPGKDCAGFGLCDWREVNHMSRSYRQLLYHVKARYNYGKALKIYPHLSALHLCH